MKCVIKLIFVKSYLRIFQVSSALSSPDGQSSSYYK